MATLLYSELSQHFMTISNLLGGDRFENFFQTEIYPIMQASWERRFASQTGPDGESWSSDLVDTGQLRASFSLLGIDTKHIVGGPSEGRNQDVALAQAEIGNLVAGFDTEALEAISEALSKFLDSAFMGG